MDKIVLACAQRVTTKSAANIRQDIRTKLSSLAVSNPMVIRVRARTKILSVGRIFRVGIETRGEQVDHTIRLVLQQGKLPGTSIADTR